ncbi:MAG TPA: translation initiation factor IF-2 [Rhodothermales bacterium]|nr:translation initiation factor IF-2 [Rhodothermales bacterium]
MAKENQKFKKVRLYNVARELNVTVETVTDHLKKEGFKAALAGTGINAAITDEDAYLSLLEAFASDKAAASRVKDKRAALRAEAEETDVELEEPVLQETPAPVPPSLREMPAPVQEEQELELPPVEERVEAVAEVPPVVEPLPEETVEPVAEEPAEEAHPEPHEAVAAGDSADVDVESVPSVPAEPEPAPVAEVEEAPGAEAETEEEEAEPAAVEATGDGQTEAPEEAASILTADRYKLAGTKIVGKIDLHTVEESDAKKKRKRKRKRKDRAVASEESPKETTADSASEAAKKKRAKRKRGPAVDEAAVEQSLQETLRELEQGASRIRSRRRRERRDLRAAERQRVLENEQAEEGVLRITEFVSTGELANLMGVPVTDVISTLFKAGMMVSINQRLDADTISILADEYGFEVEFITEFGTEDIHIEEDRPEDLVPRAPVVTVMGHVDHGKTSLLDHIRRTNVVAGESGGITQHIGAYHVELQDGRTVTFLDTPGHEAFTAMRARGAKATDVVILVVAADDSVMPQTIEAINHARAAEVPIVVAINKVDKPDANPPKVMQQLSDHGVLVEQYGGKTQCALVSAKTGEGVDDLLERVVLESELLELKANPDRNADGVVIESRLDKGRGNVATVLVQNGTLKIGDVFVAGIFSGRVRAMFDERENRITEVGPARPALVVGFDGAPEVGDQFVVFDEERQAREIAQRRQQIHREQSLRQRKHITLDEIGRRLALGEFRELNLIIKADVGGSVEALSDSLLKLSTEEVAVNIIHSGVGAITESDVMLASASDAVILGFQVRPTPGSRQLAEREEIDIRTYSVIYKAIEDVHDALEGLLAPEESERTLGTAEVRETFRVPKIGTIAGCSVLDGRIHRNDRVRLVRDGVVIYTGTISSLKRFKDDVREVTSGYECGMSIDNFHDLKVGDQIEAFEIVETKRKLEV